MFMSLSCACRLLYRLTGVTKSDIETIDKDFKYFVATCHSNIYRGSAERLLLRLSKIATLLDIFLFLRACGPAWGVWQLPMDRKIGALGKLIRSSSRPHASLVANTKRQLKSDLVTPFGKTFTAQKWGEATGQQRSYDGLPVGGLLVPERGGSEFALLPRRSAVVVLTGEELTNMRALLRPENADHIPSQMMARK